MKMGATASDFVEEPDFAHPKLVWPTPNLKFGFLASWLRLTLSETVPWAAISGRRPRNDEANNLETTTIVDYKFASMRC